MTLKNRTRNRNSMKNVSEFYREILFIHVNAKLHFYFTYLHVLTFFNFLAPVPKSSVVRRSNEANESGIKDYQDMYWINSNDVCLQNLFV